MHEHPANLQPVHRQAHRVAVALAAGLLLAATACSSTHETAASSTTTASTPVGPTTSVAPTTTVDPARESMLQGILDSHHAAGEFVGGSHRAARRDGAITEATSGTQTVDPASGPVDPDTAWNIGSVTKTFVAVVVLQLAEEGRIDLDAGHRAVPARPCRAPTGSRLASCCSTPAGSTSTTTSPRC